jgi:hypothetical protein
MQRRLPALVLAAVLGLGALASPAFAQFSISIDIAAPPPAERVEVVREVRPGWVWLPGFWGWEGHRHVWVEGRWERVRPGHHWAPARWERRGDLHHFEPGRWEPDAHSAIQRGARQHEGFRHKEGQREEGQREENRHAEAGQHGRNHRPDWR